MATLQPELLWSTSGALRNERFPMLRGDLSNQEGSTDVRVYYLQSLSRTDITLSNGANNNIDVGVYTWVRIAGPSAGFSISGFVAGSDGQVLMVFNSTTQQMTITNDATSTAANRIYTLTGADVVLRAGRSFASFIYDSTLSRWILVSTN